MVDPNIVEYIKTNRAKGYSDKVLSDALIARGYDPKQVQEAMSGGTPSFDVKSLLTKKNMIIVGGVVGVIILALVAYLLFPKSVCGDGVVSAGETSETCCEDVGCVGDQDCHQGYCFEPDCTDCQYLENHRCISYACCSDVDCDDGDESTKDVCLDPSRPSAACSFDRVFEMMGNSSVLLSAGEMLTVKLGYDEFVIELEDVKDEMVTFDIQPDIVKMSMRVGIGTSLNINENSIQDVFIRVNSISGTTANISLNKLSYGCSSDTECDDNNSLTLDFCLYPGTHASLCSFSQVHECEVDSDCDDLDTSTKDQCIGSPKECVSLEITDCVDNDYFCPGGCTVNNDVDCEDSNLPLDCGENEFVQEGLDAMLEYQCFIDASVSCQPAALVNQVDMVFLGVHTESTTLMKLMQTNSSTCRYYQQIESASIEYTNELNQQLLDSGLNQSQVDEQEQQANDAVQETVGDEKNCVFAREDLTAVLNSWASGSFSTSDFDVAECDD